ncbi:hypothetical protein GWK50_01850 [Acidovorax sp. 210-6]|uniref:hypothetical protein n=1 Tax=Acidovorax sp. 210-6 TaxID=2699468 RepID=UPI001389A5A3|nr:hypothetical protein [Acidovorax sp. 210-6]NCU64600.1 hypothetical protein [Acidovorax sp. 210-6]
MMLLQAGQLGLSRRDSIWTDEIPPEMVAGATMWVDFTDSTTLFAANGVSGGNVTSDGATIGSVRSKVVETEYFDSVYADKPKLKLAAANGRSAGLFPASSYPQMYATAGGGWMPISSLVTSTTKLVICGVKVTGAGADSGSPWANDAILNDNRGYVGLHLSKSGAVVSARAYNYAGAAQEVVRTFDADTWAVVTMSHQSGQLRCRVNGGTWASTASGTTSDVTGIATIASTSSAALGMELAHLATVNTPQTDAAISAVERWIANDLGIAPWW